MNIPNEFLSIQFCKFLDPDQKTPLCVNQKIKIPKNEAEKKEKKLVWAIKSMNDLKIADDH